MGGSKKKKKSPMSNAPAELDVRLATRVTEQLKIEYRPLSEVVEWDKNAKLHAEGKIQASIVRHGFRDAIIFDQTLGALVAGNGRLQILRNMKAMGIEAPTGIRVDPDSGEWLVPVQVGMDAKSVQDAVAFAIDHNNLVPVPSAMGYSGVVDLWNRVGLAKILQDSGDTVTVRVSGAGLDIDSTSGELVPRPDRKDPDSGFSAFDGPGVKREVGGIVLRCGSLVLPVSANELAVFQAEMKRWLDKHGSYSNFLWYVLTAGRP